MPFIPNPNGPGVIDVSDADYIEWADNLSAQDAEVNPFEDPEIPGNDDTLVRLNDGLDLGVPDEFGFVQDPVTGLNILPEDVPEETALEEDLVPIPDPDVSLSDIQDNPIPGPYQFPSGPDGSTPYDDDGNLNPGWTLDEDGNPVYVGGDFIEPATLASAEASRTFAFAELAKKQNAIAAQRKQVNNGDWRVKLRLAPGAKYLYNAPSPGIMQPLKITDGVVFPYTPQIDTAYKANYDAYDLTHSNYRGYFYKSSNVDTINLRCTFTAQSTAEANYLLAVITFFKSATKMFYGQDAERGAPPPLLYLTGLGEYQFNEHPCVLSQFNYNLPADVDYVRAGSPNNVGLNLLNQRDRQNVATYTNFGSLNRLAAAILTKGALPSPLAPAALQIANPTYVPTKMDISISLLPIQSRKQVSKQFSLKEFSNGNLIKGGFW